MKKEYIVLMYGAIAVIVIIFMTAILKKLGIFKSAAVKNVDKNLVDIQTADYFNPSYYKTVGAFKPLGGNMSLTLATKIRKALRGIGTDENAIYDVFNQMYNKANISEVAESYYLEYKKDMKVDLLNDLGKKEVSMLMDIVNSMPNKI